MDFARVLRDVVGGMEKAGVRYALIGGFAMALRGVQRATAGLDFILTLQDMAQADAILTQFNYQRVFHNENVSHYQSPEVVWGRIDILHAFRAPSLGMIERAETIAVEPDLPIRVARVEDIMGLKIQALCNNPIRAESDWLDIRLLLAAARENQVQLDWQLINDYLGIFHLEDKLDELRRIHGSSNQK